jgi:hypothetical protein
LQEQELPCFPNATCTPMTFAKHVEHVSIELRSMFARLKNCSVGASRHFAFTSVGRAHNLHDKPARGNACLRALSAGTAAQIPGRTIRPLATMNNDTSQKPKALLHCGERPALRPTLQLRQVPDAVVGDFTSLQQPSSGVYLLLQKS